MSFLCNQFFIFIFIFFFFQGHHLAFFVQINLKFSKRDALPKVLIAGKSFIAESTIKDDFAFQEFYNPIV